MIKDTMAKTLSTLLAGCGVSLFPALSYGLGLGDIQIESRLNQPLYARIEIVDVSDEEWRQIRARIPPRTLLSEGSVHPEILGSLTLRAVEDARHGHFIEIKSGEALIEPLFDLPIEVVGQSLQVVRNYSVLLDPPSAEDSARGVAVAALARADADTATQGANTRNAPVLHVLPQAGTNDAAAGSAPAVAGVDTQTRSTPAAHVARHKGRGSRVARSSGHHKAPSSTNTTAPANRVAPANTAVPANTAAANAVTDSSVATGANATASSAATGTSAASAAHVAYATSAATAAEQQQLEGQLTSLQETLTKMQATIAAQDVEIAKLMAQVTARNNSQALARREPTPQAQSDAAEPDVADTDASDARPSLFQRWRTTIYWIAGVAAGAVILVIGAALFMRRRNAIALREIERQEAARRAPREEQPKSDPLAWQSTLRAAHTGTWQSPSATDSSHGMASRQSISWTTRSDSASKSDAVAVETSELPEFEESNAGATRGTAEPVSADTVVATVAVEELTQDLEADLEALNASYENEIHENSSTGLDEWRTQTAMLERDFLSDTEALPFVLEEGNQAKSIETGRNPVPASRLSVEKTMVDEPAEEPAPVATKRSGAANEPVMVDAASEHSHRHREVVEILEQSLDFEPGRVDIQLKLLEIYHHEALGNRGNFESLLRKLAADPQRLSPAQQLHVEMLQRTLQDGKHASDSDFVTEVAI